MDLNCLRREIKRLNFDALRTDHNDRFEAVIGQQEIDKLNLQLKSRMGEPVFPSENRLPHKVQETVNVLGGIMAGQTLYYKASETNNIFAMLWPWKDGQHTTIKIIQQNNYNN